MNGYIIKGKQENILWGKNHNDNSLFKELMEKVWLIHLLIIMEYKYLN